MAWPLKITRQRVLAAMIVFSLATSLSGPWAARMLRGVLAPLLAPFGDGAMYVVNVLAERTEELTRPTPEPAQLDRLSQQLATARNEVNYWRFQAEQLKKQIEAADHFRGFYGPDPNLGAVFIPARVVGVDSLPYGHTRLTNAGSRRGVSAGELVTTRQIVHDRSKALPEQLAVIGPESLVGRVSSQTEAFTARIELVTSPQFSTPVHIRRKPDGRMVQQLEPVAAEVALDAGNNQPVKAMAHGDGREGMVIYKVPKGDHIKIGDNINTLPGQFSPFEIHIGKVSDVSPDPENPRFAIVRVNPTADLDRLRQVFVIQSKRLSPAEGRR